ncbi:hypothetical protein A2V49_03710 [candidate division WWE3 bacterium RBG_19FT_COMBO_34_6]|uniref:Uncharacterized protein n=1 Tax=candidate division WWE3 bacterium RBG_19FT_COMBO_34_6 TaxID=1802612 RepID=A0A1F4UKR8_UNCKA|nr:MAG: hypothetical protein A2V49_03710 [candidate division WWE3 bacterium RBG_19FT_COMBO_34_6]
MDSDKILSLINLNNSFYTKHQEEFSKSRRNPWSGWNKFVDLINKRYENQNTIKVLDIGCGNGRFYNFLAKSCNISTDYLGLDNNDYFLIEAVLKYKKANFKKIDVFYDIDKISEKYDILAVFGVTHHIPGNSFRKEWFKKIIKLVNKNGIICLSFWNLLSDLRSVKLIKADGLENNDYYYGWSDSNDQRYVHLFNQKELMDIKEIFEANNFFLKSDFLGDGKNEKMNIYQVFEKKTISYP